MGKGGDFEREIAKCLTVWLTGKDKPYAYWRMPGSGSLSTIHEQNKNLSGDIMALISEAEFLTNSFSIECKTGYPQTSFWQHFGRVKNFNIEIFWRQAFEDATKGAKHPMLIYRKKGRKPIIGISEWISNVLKINNLPSVSFCFSEDTNLPQLRFFDFNDFWKEVTPQKIKDMRSKGL
jgi:hypothetical protein